MKTEDAINRIGQRDWISLKAFWNSIIHIFDFPIVEPEEDERLEDEIQKICEEIASIEIATTNRFHYFQVEGIQARVFQESVFLFYKGINAIKSGQCDQVGGYKTWSLNNYYQSSYFFTRAILGLLGVHQLRSRTNKYLLIDLYPQYRNTKPKEIEQRRRAKEQGILIIRQMEHYQYWSLLKRVLSITRNTPLPTQDAKLFRRATPKSFAHYRNMLIYQNDYWSFDDLKNEVYDLNFGIQKLDGIDMDSAEYQHAATIFTSYSELNLLNTLFQDISKQNNNFLEEYKFIEIAIKQSNNALFSRFHTLNYV